MSENRQFRFFVNSLLSYSKKKFEIFGFKQRYQLKYLFFFCRLWYCWNSFFLFFRIYINCSVTVDNRSLIDLLFAFLPSIKIVSRPISKASLLFTTVCNHSLASFISRLTVWSSYWSSFCFFSGVRVLVNVENNGFSFQKNSNLEYFIFAQRMTNFKHNFDNLQL